MKKYHTIYYKYTILLGILLIVVSKVVAQQNTQYSMYMFNPMLINPAVAGSEYFHEIKFGYRNQWLGLKNSETGESISPATYYVSGHGHIGQHIGPNKGKSKTERYRHHGIGALVTNDVIGPFNTFSAYAVYAYNITLMEDVKLSMGAGVGFQQWRLDGSKLQFTSDQAATNIGSITRYLPDANVGLWFSAKSYFLSLSANQILQNKFKFVDNSTGIASGGNKLNTQLFVYTGYGFIFHENIHLIPSVLVKYQTPNLASFDMNMKGKYVLHTVSRRSNIENAIWAGISYRHNDGILALMGFTYNSRYDIGLSYNYVTSALRLYQGGSLEVFLGLKIAPKQQIASPSDFWE